MKEDKCIKCGRIRWIDKDGICYDCWHRAPIEVYGKDRQFYRRIFKD